MDVGVVEMASWSVCGNGSRVECPDSPGLCGACCHKMHTDAAVGRTKGGTHTGLRSRSGISPVTPGDHWQNG